MIVARPDKIMLRAWDGKRFWNSQFNTADISHCSNCISSRDLDELPVEMGPFVKTVVYFYAETRKKPALVLNELDYIYTRLAPHYEVEPNSEAASLWYHQAST
jgi:hypothetical protein